MDTGAGAKGFSIIAQGTIGQMITAKPEDRKNLIEEAAGITKFKARKKESQRKLQATDQNLVRLQDITGELKRQIDSLQRQAQRAERYRNLKTQIEDLDLWLASVQYKELSDKAESAQKVFDEVTEFEVTGESDLLQMQSDLEQMRLLTLEKEKEVENIQNLHFALQTETQKKEMSLQGLKFEIEQGRRNEQMTGTILEEQKARHELLARDQADLSARVQELKIEVTEIQTEFSIKNETFQVSQSRIAVVDQDLTSHRRELFAVGQTLSAVEAKIAALESQTEDLQSRLENDQTVYSELNHKMIDFEKRKIRIFNELEQGRQMALDFSNDVEAFEANKRILTAKVEEKRSEIETFKTELNEVTGRLYGLENLQNNFEGFDEGVKKVMLWQKSKAETEVHADGTSSTYFRPVSEVVEVPADYEIAMEAALGTRLQTLLASDNSASVEAVQYLKDNKSGRSSFFSYDKLNQDKFNQASHEGFAKSSAAPSGVGVHSLLKDVVKSDEAFAPSVSMLLSQVAVVDSIRKALELRPEFPGWTFVTLDGDTLTADGVLTGGSSESAESGVLKRRREIKELTQKKNEWAGKLSLAQLALKKVEANLANVMNDFEGAQKRRMDQEIHVTELKKDLERSEHELAHAKHAVERQEREVQKTQLQIQTLEEKTIELQSHCEESRTKKFELESVIAELDQELNVNRNGIGGLQEEVMGLKVRLATKSQDLEGNERQLAGVEKSLGDLNHQLSRMNEEQSKNSTSLSENQYRLELEKIELEKLIVSVEEAKERLSMSRDQYEVQHQNSRDLEERVSALQKTRNDLQMKMNSAKLQLEQAQLKEQYLIDQIRERYIIELPDVVARYEGREGDTHAAEKDLKDLKERISKIGDVNLSAIEEYEETSKR
jgi:chromosome segregation protein